MIQAFHRGNSKENRPLTLILYPGMEEKGAGEGRVTIE